MWRCRESKPQARSHWSKYSMKTGMWPFFPLEITVFSVCSLQHVYNRHLINTCQRAECSRISTSLNQFRDDPEAARNWIQSLSRQS